MERTQTVEETEYVSTTIVETLTVPTSFFVTVTVSETIVTTQLTTEFSTIVSTHISSVPVTITREGPEVTVPGPGETVTLEPPPVTITEVSECPAPTNDISAAEQAPLDPNSDLTWGCGPGYLCSPPKPQGCNFWADSPLDSFVCAPEDCIRAPPYYQVSWPENETDWYPPTEGYFHLDPRAFGLSFDIFEPPEEVVKTIHGKETTIFTGNYESQTDLTHFPLPSSSAGEGDYHERRDVVMRYAIKERSLWKRDDTVYPSVCYAQCQNAYSESLKTGKSDELCEAGSLFLRSLGACTACVAEYDDETPSSERTYLEDKFKQFSNFCSGSDAEPTNGGGDDDDDDDDDDGPQSQVTTTSDEEVSTQSQAPGNTETSAVPITSETETTSEGSASETGGASPSPSETAGDDDGDDEDSAGPTPTSGAGGGGGSDGDEDDDEGSNDDSDDGNTDGGSNEGSNGGADDDNSDDSGDSDDSDGSSGDGDSPGSGGSGVDSGSDGDSGSSGTGGDSTDDGSGAGGSSPDGTSDDDPDASPTAAQAAAVSHVPGHMAAMLPLLGGLFFLL